MTDRAAIQGSLVGIRNVSTHKSTSLIIHIPEEQAQSFIDAFGWPTMANPVPVALARIQPSALKQQLQASVEIERKKEPKPWETIQRSQQSAIAGSNPDFWAFLNGQLQKAGRPAMVTDAESAATAVRVLCGVNSRTWLDDNPVKAAAWDHLYSEYQLERRGAIA